MVAPFYGFFGDVNDFVGWGRVLNADFFHVYSLGSRPTALWAGLPPNYPPLAIYAFGLSVRAYTAVVGATRTALNFDVYHSPQLAAAMKVPTILADLGLAALLYRLGAAARGPVWGVTLAGLWLLSPVAIFIGALWGQVDVLPVPFLVGGLVLAARRRYGWAGLCLGLAILWKPQPIVFGPLAAAYLLRWGGWRALLRASLPAAAVNLVAWAPYLGSELRAYLANAAGTFTVMPAISSHAWNFWWIVGLAERPHTESLVGSVTLEEFGWVLFGAVAVVAILAVLRKPDEGTLLTAAGMIALALFVFAPLQHERYIVPAVPLFLAAAATRPRALGWFALMSIAAILNMAFVALETLRPGERYGPFVHVDPSPTIAAVVAAELLFVVVAMAGTTLRRAALVPRLVPA